MATRNLALAKSLTYLTDDGLPNFASGSDIVLTPDSDTGVISTAVTVGGQSATAVNNYSAIDSLPLSNLTAGSLSYVQSTGTFYYSNGSGWYKITTTNSAPIIVDGADTSYTLAIDGSSTVISLSASDSDGTPLTWSYSITSGALGNTATISQDSSVFTITPSTNESDAGSFDITFSVTDGFAIATDTATITLSFTSYIDLSTFSAAGTKSTPMSIAQTGFGLEFKDDGTKMYTSDATSSGTGAQIRTWSLSTPWDVTTATLDGTYNLNLSNFGHMDIFIGDNGTKLYVLGDISDTIRQYTLTTPWDVTTATFVRSLSLGALGTVTGIYFSSDGGYLFLTREANSSNWDIAKWILNTPWDISTRGTSQTINTWNENSEDQASCCWISSNGEQFFYGGRRSWTSGQIVTYDLTTPYDFSTRTNKIAYSSIDGQITTMRFSGNGQNMYVLGWNQTVYWRTP